MAAEPDRIEIAGSTNILDVVDDVERTHEPRILQRGDEMRSWCRLST